MWVYTTIAFACISLALTVALCIALSWNVSSSVEPRLLGTWVSDADRTIEMMPASTGIESEAIHKTRMLLGKMKVSFSPTEMEITLDGQSDRIAYRILAADDYSCVIAETSGQAEVDKETADVLRISSYNVIHFEDQNLYWVQSQLGGFAEYFPTNTGIEDGQNHGMHPSRVGQSTLPN